MTHLNHRDYYVARAQSARMMAARAASPGIAAIHAEMANCYEYLALEMSQETMRREIRPLVSV